MKKLLTLALSLALTAAVGVASANTKLVVGASATPHAEILEAAKPILAEKGIDLEIVVFDDYVQPNLQLEAGDLDANYFQHIPYLEDFNAQNGTHLVSAGAVHYEPMGLYVNPAKAITLDSIPDGATIAIPNDTTNESRALGLLEFNGLLKLNAAAGQTATVLDVAENRTSLSLSRSRPRRCRARWPTSIWASSTPTTRFRPVRTLSARRLPTRAPRSPIRTSSLSAKAMTAKSSRRWSKCFRATKS